MLAALNTTLILLTAENSGSSSTPANSITLTGVVFIAVCLLSIVLMRRKSTKTVGPEDYTREASARIRQQQGVKQDMEAVMLQLSELARQLNGQMDTRFAKLEQTILEADKKIATLEALLRKVNGSEPLDVTVDDKLAMQPATPASPAPSPARQPNKPRKPNKQSRKPEEPRKPAPTPPAAVTPAVSAARPPTPPPASTPAVPQPANNFDPRYSKIYTLADQGQTPVEIARQTGQTTGEIELILNLRKTQIR